MSSPCLNLALSGASHDESTIYRSAPGSSIPSRPAALDERESGPWARRSATVRHYNTPSTASQPEASGELTDRSTWSGPSSDRAVTLRQDPCGMPSPGGDRRAPGHPTPKRPGQTPSITCRQPETDRRQSTSLVQRSAWSIIRTEATTGSQELVYVRPLPLGDSRRHPFPPSAERVSGCRGPRPPHGPAVPDWPSSPGRGKQRGARDCRSQRGPRERFLAALGMTRGHFGESRSGRAQ